MGEWKDSKLIDVLDALIDYRGKTPNKTEFGIPLVTAKIVKDGNLLPYSEFIAVSDYDSWMVRGIPQKGDLVMTTEAPLGEVSLLKGDKVALAQRIVTLRGKENVLDTTFLKYFIQSNLGQLRLQQRATGSTVLGIKQSELKKVIISYPNYSEQKKIANILSSLDDKIETNRKINARLEELAQGLFKSWFIDFEPFGGVMPEGWEECKLEDILTVKYGKDHKHLADGFFPVYGSGGIMRYVEKPLYEKESVLIPRKGTLNNIFYLDEPFWSVDTMFFTEMKRMNVAKYVFFFLKRMDFQSMNCGSAIPSMTTAILNGLKINLPSEEVLMQFDNLISPIFDKVKTLQKESARLAQLRDAFLQKLMSGEIKVG